MDLVTLLPAVTRPAVNIPIWNQYTHFLTGILDGLATLVHSAGLGIILFTIIVKTLMLPLTVQSIRSSKAMQELQPKIKELQKKYGNDRQRISQETMALYQQHRVNPMAGCLPMVIQIPIFFGLYNAIITLSTLRAPALERPFLWLHSLAHPDPIHILPIMAGIFQFVQTQMMRPANQRKVDRSAAGHDELGDELHAAHGGLLRLELRGRPGALLGDAEHLQRGSAVVHHRLGQHEGNGLPSLPELPEHRRLGYRPPRNLDDVVVVSGEGSRSMVLAPMGWFQRKMQRGAAAGQGRDAAAPWAGDGKAERRGRGRTRRARRRETARPKARPRRQSGERQS